MNIDANSFNEDNFKFITETGKYFDEDGIVYKIELKVKENIDIPKDILFKVKEVEASNGEVDIKANDAQITLHIEEKIEDEAKITSEKYVIDEEFISRILSNTTVSEFKENVECNREIIITDKDGNELDEDYVIGTGMTLKADTLEFKLVVIGDINEDGRISVTDIAQLKLHYIEQEILTEMNLMAADINGDGKISISDVAELKLIYIGLEETK